MEWQSRLNNEDHVSIRTTLLDEMLLQVLKHSLVRAEQQ
jgi:hypothetical protein